MPERIFVEYLGENTGLPYLIFSLNLTHVQGSSTVEGALFGQ